MFDIKNVKNDFKYYGQDEIVEAIRIKTGISVDNIKKVLNALGDVVKEKLSSGESHMAIRVFSGLTIKGKYTEMKTRDFNTNDVETKLLLNIRAKLSRYFKNEVRELYVKNTQK